jgi:hypothetical protein
MSRRRLPARLVFTHERTLQDYYFADCARHRRVLMTPLMSEDIIGFANLSNAVHLSEHLLARSASVGV